MTRLVPLIAAVCLNLAVPAAAQSDFCMRLSDLQAVAAYPDIEDVSVALIEMGAAVATCQHVLELGGARSLSCNWPFPYRSDEARLAFEALVAAVTECRGAPVASDPPVNHPDSYDLLVFADGISTALKDKAALRETHVILRVQG